jgi:hypothetical protein
LTAWLRLLALTGDLAVVEPKLLRFKMLHVPARLSRGGRRRRLRLPRHWPWAGQILEAFHRIMIIPAPTSSSSLSPMTSGPAPGSARRTEQPKSTSGWPAHDSAMRLNQSPPARRCWSRSR